MQNWVSTSCCMNTERGFPHEISHTTRQLTMKLPFKSIIQWGMSIETNESKRRWRISSRANLSVKANPHWLASASAWHSAAGSNWVYDNGNGRISNWKDQKLSTHLNAVITSCHSSILNFDICRWMCELALGVGARALVSLEFAAYLELQPSWVFAVQQIAHVYHCGHNYFFVLREMMGKEKFKYFPSASSLVR